MDINTINEIKSREDFLEFVKDHVISDDNDVHVNDYLESVVSWVEDMDGFYANLGLKKPEAIDWSFVATLFYVGRIYE